MSKSKKLSVNSNIKKAHTIESHFYTDNYFFNLSINKIFKNSWQYIVNRESIINITQYPFIFLQDTIHEPLVLTIKNNNFYCLSNVCTHRGNIICNKQQSENNLQCGYHGRLFNLSGSFKSMPGFKNVENFPLKNDNLLKLPLLKWRNFFFTSLNINNNQANHFNFMNKTMDWYPFEKLVHCKESSNEYIINAHWAIYCENYLEGFHVPYVHNGLNKNIEFSKYNTELFDNGVLQTAYSELQEKTFINIKGCPQFMEKIYAQYYWVFPNIMFNYYSWGMSINIIEPLNKNKTKIKFLSFPFNNNKQPLNDSDSLDKVEYEDQKVVQQVQIGINSKFYYKGRYSADYEQGVHHFHKLLCEYLN